MPRHRWKGTALQFEQGPDGDEWGDAVDLEGPKGPAGAAGFGGVITAPSTKRNTYFPSGW